MKPPVIAVVQARMGASRLPNKMMLWLHGLSVVGWVYHRVMTAKLIDGLVFAIPNTAVNQILKGHLIQMGARVVCGEEMDVLGRTILAAQACHAGTVIRVCADNPLVCGSEIDRLVNYYQQGDYDYVYNHVPKGNTYPDGLGAEIASMEVLQSLHSQAVLDTHREHVFNYIWDNPRQFRIGTCDPLDSALAHPELKLDLDTIEDYAALLEMDLRPDMVAREVVTAALSFHSKI